MGAKNKLKSKKKKIKMSQQISSWLRRAEGSGFKSFKFQILKVQKGKLQYSKSP